jgi:hypothetical protein
MKRLLTIAIGLFLLQVSFAQRISRENLISLQKKEDTLKQIAYQILNGRSPQEGFIADSQFTRLLVKALKTKNSFYYPFDSLITISKLTAPDSSFRIFTWQLEINENLIRQHGAIQMRTPDGSLKIFPLIDRSENIDNPEDTVANNLGWIGAVYYKIIQKSAFGKNFYTLLGYDENNLRSNKKMIDVLSFQNGEPVFGGPYFSFPDNSFSQKFSHRYIMEYKKHAGPRLNYDADEDMIVIEHMISETGESQKKYTYVPDGDYEGLKWVNGKWVHINKIYTYKLQDGQAPIPNPINEDGKMDTQKMELDAIDKDSDDVIDYELPPPTTDSTTTNTTVTTPKEKPKKKKKKD